jgi:hypothetical protein
VLVSMPVMGQRKGFGGIYPSCDSDVHERFDVNELLKVLIVLARIVLEKSLVGPDNAIAKQSVFVFPVESAERPMFLSRTNHQSLYNVAARTDKT